MKTMKLFLLFMAGGLIYGGVEIIHRGWTHVSMFIVGGICFVLIGSISFWRKDIPVTVRMLISAVMITLLELISGLILNVSWGLNVWDYSNEPLNFMGQICLHASAIWVFLSFVGIYTDVFMRRGMFNEKTAVMRII